MKTFLAALIGALVLVPAFVQPSAAEDERERRERQEHREHGREEHREERREDWHGGDIHRFHEHDFDTWRGGAWFHGEHEGRAGWWWRVGPSWYFYAAPVYPYPDPYVPPVVVAPPATPAQYWYYCPNPQGYYPYVPQCFAPWQPVPAR